MVQRRITPIDEPDRINERLFDMFGDEITDRDSYNDAFNRLWELRESQLTSQQRKLRDDSFSRSGIEEKTTKARRKKVTRRTTVKEVPRPQFKGAKTKFIFRSEIRMGKKKVTVFRDKRGRFVGKPKKK